MWLPFRRELDVVFRSDLALGWKMLGCAGATAFLVTSATLKGIAGGDLPIRPTILGMTALAAAAATLGAGLALGLALKDVVRRRVEGGEPVHPALRAYFGPGGWSLAAWFATMLVVA